MPTRRKHDIKIDQMPLLWLGKTFIAIKVCHIRKQITHTQKLLAGPINFMVFWHMLRNFAKSGTNRSWNELDSYFQKNLFDNIFIVSFAQLK